MKHLLTLLVILLFTLPLMAQDDPAPAATVESGSVVIVSGEGDTGTTVVEGADEGTVIVTPQTPTDPLAYVVIVVLALILMATLIFGARFIPLLATLVPPETASSIYQSGVRFGLQMGLNQASVTATELDDEFFEGLARSNGFEVIKHADGHYEVKTPTASRSSVAGARVDYTTTSSQ